MDITPEVQAVIDAAAAWKRGRNPYSRGVLIDAVDAYQESIKPPEPFTWYMARRDGDEWFSERAETWLTGAEVYEVLVTPVRKVR